MRFAPAISVARAFLLADQNVKFCRKVADRGCILEKGLIQLEGTMESIRESEAILRKHLAV